MIKMLLITSKKVSLEGLRKLAFLGISENSFVLPICVCVLVAQLCLTLWDPMDCSENHFYKCSAHVSQIYQSPQSWTRRALKMETEIMEEIFRNSVV